MALLSVEGQVFNNPHSAKVQIIHGEDALEAEQYPLCQFVIELPLDKQTMFAEWALAPVGKARWKKVELKTRDIDENPIHTWTLKKAYVHSLREIEFGEGSGSATDQGNYFTVVLRGVLEKTGVAHDGKNVLEVAKG